jgi:hypothetical protein
MVAPFNGDAGAYFSQESKRQVNQLEINFRFTIHAKI